MWLTLDIPGVANAARTSDTDARKSVAMTGAGVRPFRPLTVAVPPLTRISAPIRNNSGTCIKRFSKIVSEICDEPSAIHIIAMNCACKSVGKPGNGSVVISAACGRPFPLIRIVRAPQSWLSRCHAILPATHQDDVHPRHAMSNRHRSSQQQWQMFM